MAKYFACLPTATSSFAPSARTLWPIAAGTHKQFCKYIPGTRVKRDAEPGPDGQMVAIAQSKNSSTISANK